MKKKVCFLLVGVSLLWFRCSTTKSVPEGDQLYTGATVHIQSDESKKYRKRLAPQLQKLIKPKPNSKVLGMPLKLYFYNALGQPKKNKGIKYTLRKKLGQPPVLFSKVNPSYTREVLAADLYNKGFFHAQVTYNLIESEKKMHVEYMVHTGPAYRIKSYSLETQNAAINTIIEAARSKTKLKPKRRYSLEGLKDERIRLDKELKNNGYYFFNPDYFIFLTDSVQNTRELSLHLKLKQEAPDKALRSYRLRHVQVVSDSTSADENVAYKKDTIREDTVQLLLGKNFKPKPIARYVFLKEGHIYSREKHQLTLNRLMGMSLFKYVDLKIEENDSTTLDAFIHLAPLPKKSISLEVQAVTKSNNFVGPGLNTNYINRNLFRGGEKLTLGFHGSVETQLNGQFKGLYTYQVGPKAQFSIPRFILPFRVGASSLYTPQTLLSLDYNFVRRVGYFDMNSLKFTAGYRWKESLAKDHELMPISINFFNLRNVSPSFNGQLARDISLRRRYEDQLIAGTTYSYTYNEQVITSQKSQFYFNGNIDIAGNTVALLSSLAPEQRNENGVRTFLGSAYAQYARFDVDLRNYLHINKKQQLVGRFLAGWGIPYGNSSSLPYIKGFFSGGANSVRAFSVNSLGPGTYRLPDSLLNSFFAQQGGDIKLEFNVEYRFPLISVVKGAVFADAGNTWLSRPNSELGIKAFNPSTALKEVAIGAGFGVRVDLNFFVIRLDVATPLRKPWLPEANRWVLDDWNPSDKTWRKENILLNIAIGYPF